MYMTANRIKIEGQPVLKLNIHDFSEDDVPFLDNLGIDTLENKEQNNWRYKLIYNQEDFLNLRTVILERYEVEEKGHRAYMTLKAGE